MKTQLRLRTFVLSSIAFVTGLCAVSRDTQWQKVEDARQKGLPNAAIEALEPVIKEVIANHAYAEAIKAIGLKIAFEGNLQGNKPEENIARMRTELKRVGAVALNGLQDKRGA